jgi:hypothetical protein
MANKVRGFYTPEDSLPVVLAMCLAGKRGDPHLGAYQTGEAVVFAEHLLVALFEERLLYHQHSLDEIAGIIRQLMSGAMAMKPLSVKITDLSY